jgi:superfamily II DNA or RNA helicase
MIRHHDNALPHAALPLDASNLPDPAEFETDLDDLVETQSKYLGLVNDARGALEDALEQLGGALEEVTCCDNDSQCDDRDKRDAYVAAVEAARAAYETLSDEHGDKTVAGRLRELEERFDDGGLLHEDNLAECVEAVIDSVPERHRLPERNDDLLLALAHVRDTGGAEALQALRPHLSSEGAEAARRLALLHVEQQAPEPTPDTGVEAPQVPDAPSLARFRQTPRPYQADMVEDALRFCAACDDLDDTVIDEQRRIMYSLPTGGGKGSASLWLLKRLRDGDPTDPSVPGLPEQPQRDAWILTPSLEVIRGFLERTGVDAKTLRESSAEKLHKLAARIRVTTPVRLDNYLRDPKPENLLAPYVTGVPDVIIYDEAHHAIEENSVSGNLFAMAPHATWIGLTATPYRGTPRGTQALEAAWREIVEVLDIPAAVRLGAWALPTFEVVGLVDDDRIKLSGGDFQAKAAGKAVGSRIEDLAALTRRRFVGSDPLVFDGGDALDPRHRVPTAVTVPNREAAGLLVEALDRLGVDAVKIDANTKTRDRAVAYDAAREGRAVLVSVRVISEGVDLPWLRRLIDARPTMSPVSFVQQLGRITRPGDVRPEYVCVCRNLERHAYLLGGCVPPQAVKAAQDAFEKPSKRDSLRSVGLEQLSRHKPILLHLADGLKGRMFSVYTIDEQSGAKTCYAALQHPSFATPIYAARTDKRLDEPQGSTNEGAAKVWDWGKWRRVNRLPDTLEGWSTSSARGKATERQRESWRRNAARVGLDPEAANLEKLTKREVEPLFVLLNTKANMQPHYLRSL